MAIESKFDCPTSWDEVFDYRFLENVATQFEFPSGSKLALPFIQGGGRNAGKSRRG
jgi:hypothetical protein